MLLLCLKNLGEYLCPRCTIPKKWVSDIGTVNDRNRRIRYARVDNEASRAQIIKARVRIFKKGMAVNSVKVQRLLKKGSLTPTKVPSDSIMNLSLMKY
jgi:hypothetical protein